jgi:hypothetical protein
MLMNSKLLEVCDIASLADTHVKQAAKSEMFVSIKQSIRCNRQVEFLI